MKKKRFLITAGPTREMIDPVRFISNRSSGKMGYALADAAQSAGFEVVLVSGPVAIQKPSGIKEFISVVSASEMADAVSSLAESADFIIMAAAVADYRPAICHEEKLKKSDSNLLLELERTTDILAELGRNKKRHGYKLAGFAAETENIAENAKKKLKSKNLDWIIANDISGSDAGFQSDNNKVTIYFADGRTLELPLSSKITIAEKIIRIITE